MTEGRGWRSYLQLKCFVIAYLHLLACIVDIGCHIAVVAITSQWFRCDVTTVNLLKVDWPWLEPFLLFINLGTHGFYPFPLIIRSRPNVFVDHTPLALHPGCYPGMLHVTLIDVMYLFINLVWLKMVADFVVAVHKKNTEPLRMFFAITLLKMVLQILYFTYAPELIGLRFAETESLIFVRILDIIMMAIFMYIIHQYIRQLKEDNRLALLDTPPSYIESLVASSMRMRKQAENKAVVAEKKEIADPEKETVTVVVPEEKKIESANETEKN